MASGRQRRGDGAWTLSLALAVAWAVTLPLEGANRTDEPPKPGKGSTVTNRPGTAGRGWAPGKGPVVAPGATSGAVALRAERQRPLEIPDPWLWAKRGGWMLGGIGLAGAAAWWWVRRPVAEAPPVPPLDPGVQARARILGARRRMDDARGYVGEVSDAVREYLEGRFGVRAPELTTEEFLEQLSGKPLPGLGGGDELAVFLGQCDLVKFAGWRPGGEELEGLEAAALGVVDRTSSLEVVGPGREAGVASGHGRAGS